MRLDPRGGGSHAHVPVQQVAGFLPARAGSIVVESNRCQGGVHCGGTDDRYRETGRQIG